MATSLKLLFPQTQRHAFWLGFILCLIACFFIILVIGPLTGLSSELGGSDHDGYIEIARNLVAGNGFVFEPGGPPVFHRPPMYVFTLLPIALLPDVLQRPALVVVQSLMVGIVLALTFKIARHFFGQRVAALSSLLVIINPWLYWNAKNPMTPILQTLLYLLFVILIGSELLSAAGKLPPSPSHKRIWCKRLAAGIIAAALSLSHGAMLPVSCLLLSVLLFLGIVRRKSQVIVTSTVIGLVMAAFIAPWTYRNWRTFDRFIPTVRGGPMAYFNGVGHWRCTCNQPRRPHESYIDASIRIAGFEGTERTLTHYKGFKDIQDDDAMGEKMVSDIRRSPAAFLLRTALNAVEYYFPVLTCPFLSVRSLNAEQIALTVFHLFLWLFALAGILRLRKNARPLWPSVLILVAIALYAVWYFPFATFIGHSLYTLGTIPPLSVLAACGLTGRTQEE